MEVVGLRSWEIITKLTSLTSVEVVGLRSWEIITKLTSLTSVFGQDVCPD